MKILVLIAILFLTGIGAVTPVAAQKTMTVTIFLVKDDPDADNELVAVKRSVPKTARVADAAIRELLKGATEADRKAGLASAYERENIITGRDECQSDSMKPLAAYFIGVTIRRGTAIVNFRPEAECYLQSTAFMMSRVLNPIDRTLKRFKSVKNVEFALNGKIITEWDA